MQEHEIHKVTAFQKVAPFTLRVQFEDLTEQIIDFRPVLVGELFGLLGDSRYFDRVILDEEIGTLIWPNGADFDPATLYHWPEFGPEMAARAQCWSAPVHR